MSRLEDVQQLLVENGIFGKDVRHERKPEGEAAEPEAAAEESAEPESAEGEAQEQAEPERLSVKALAEKLGVSIKDAYASVEITLPNDKVYSLGEIKDLAARGLKADKVQQAAQQANNDLLVARRELQMVADQFGGELPQEAVEKLTTIEKQRVAAEVQNFLKSVPEWADTRVRNREVAAITATAGKYGLSQAELDTLVTDARLMKMVRDFATAEPAQPKPLATRRAPAAPTFKPTGNQKADQLAKIRQLLG